MHPVLVKAALESAVLLCDTREQDTPRLRARFRQIGWPVERKKLDCGDYSVRCGCLSLAGSVAIERKYSLDELCACYCRQRGRFEREFERAKAAGTKLYLLIEDATWEDVYSGRYRSQMTPQSLAASMLAWLARYDCQLLMCRPQTSGLLIRDTLYRELKEALERMEDPQNE